MLGSLDSGVWTGERRAKKNWFAKSLYSLHFVLGRREQEDSFQTGPVDGDSISSSHLPRWEGPNIV